MDFLFNNQSDIFTWVILPILIFIARIGDVSIGTIRMIYVSKGFKVLASFLGFFEVSIWILAIGQIMQHMDNIACFLAYGTGFAMGNYVGITIEERLSIGTVIIRFILKEEDKRLIDYMRANNYGITVLEGEGSMGKVKVVFSIINRHDIPKVVEEITKVNPGVFYSIEDVKAVNEGIFRKGASRSPFSQLNIWNKKR